MFKLLKKITYNNLLFKGCVHYIFANLVCMSKREHLGTRENAFYFPSKALLVLEIINF